MGDMWFWTLYAIGSVVLVAVLLPLAESMDFWLGNLWERRRASQSLIGNHKYSGR